ncbi:hypothetical protein Droror1_Dr00005560 [Drosera rotundifolia]
MKTNRKQARDTDLHENPNQEKPRTKDNKFTITNENTNSENYNVIINSPTNHRSLNKSKDQAFDEIKHPTISNLQPRTTRVSCPVQNQHLNRITTETQHQSLYCSCWQCYRSLGMMSPVKAMAGSVHASLRTQDAAATEDTVLTAG